MPVRTATLWIPPPTPLKSPMFCGADKCVPKGNWLPHAIPTSALLADFVFQDLSGWSTAFCECLPCGNPTSILFSITRQAWKGLIWWRHPGIFPVQHFPAVSRGPAEVCPLSDMASPGQPASPAPSLCPTPIPTQSPAHFSLKMVFISSFYQGLRALG